MHDNVILYSSAEENFDEVWPAVVPGGSFQKAIVYSVCVGYATERLVILPDDNLNFSRIIIETRTILTDAIFL